VAEQVPQTLLVLALLGLTQVVMAVAVKAVNGAHQVVAVVF
jgi:hypothetical protein